MSQSATTCFVVTFRYQEEGLADLAKLTGQLTLQGFVTSVTDENGVPHELGSNSFALITPLINRMYCSWHRSWRRWLWGKHPRSILSPTTTTLSGYMLIHKML